MPAHGLRPSHTVLENASIYRAEEYGLPMDATGSVRASEDLPVDGLEDLAHTLASRPEVSDCVSGLVASWAQGRTMVGHSDPRGPSMSTLLPEAPSASPYPDLDADLATLTEHATSWARTSCAERVQILAQLKDGVNAVAERWATTAAAQKLIPPDSPLVGEEWVSGPYAVLAACNLLMATLSGMEGRAFLKDVPLRERPDGQLIAKVTPHSIWDQLLLSGVTAEVWMQHGVTRANLAENTASAYAVPQEQREGKVALVLGAGNIASIAPLDCFYKLFSEHQVVLLKMNPVNDYLTPFLIEALRPLIDRGALRIVKGDGAVGAYLCEHDLVDEIHITGAGSTHDLIVWGPGAQGEANRAANTPRLDKRITSELGAVCPTIVVPGPWTAADIRFQAEQIATQKLHNSGFNCVACQVLILPETWEHNETLLADLTQVIREVPARGLYYPGALQRMDAFAENTHNVVRLDRAGGESCLMTPAGGDAAWMQHNEVFAPAMGTVRLPNPSAVDYLRQAIAYANTELHGTLGANIIIHPATIAQMGQQTFEDLIAELHYGSIAINAWTGLAFLMAQCTWGAFPGHTLQDVQSGIGIVHNTFMFDKPERTVVRAPFRPFPRTVLSGGVTLLPRPPWFVTNKKGAQLGRLLTRFQYAPGWLKVPGIFAYALQG